MRGQPTQGRTAKLCGRYEREPGSDDHVDDDDAPPSEVELFGADLWAGIR